MAELVQKVPVYGRICSIGPWQDNSKRSLLSMKKRIQQVHEHGRTFSKGPCSQAGNVQQDPVHGRLQLLLATKPILQLAPSQMFNHDLCHGNLSFISPVSYEYLRRGEASRGAKLANPVL
jgi:hypothetical protein